MSPLLQDAGAAIVDDSFLRCFQSASSDPWNWNIYLFPLWLVGLLVRHLILFPIRCAAAHSPLLACCATETVVSLQGCALGACQVCGADGRVPYLLHPILLRAQPVQGAASSPELAPSAEGMQAPG